MPRCAVHSKSGPKARRTAAMPRAERLSPRRRPAIAGPLALTRSKSISSSSIGTAIALLPYASMRST